MRAAGIRELRNNLSRYLRRLKPGETIAVTDRGRLVAELRSPIDARRTARPMAGYARLVADGVIRPARERGDPLGRLGRGRGRAAPRGTVAALIREDRGE